MLPDFRFRYSTGAATIGDEGALWIFMMIGCAAINALGEASEPISADHEPPSMIRESSEAPLLGVCCEVNRLLF